MLCTCRTNCEKARDALHKIAAFCRHGWLFITARRAFWIFFIAHWWESNGHQIASSGLSSWD
jgi:hypothetical protein